MNDSPVGAAVVATALFCRSECCVVDVVLACNTCFFLCACCGHFDISVYF